MKNEKIFFLFSEILRLCRERERDGGENDSEDSEVF